MKKVEKIQVAAIFSKAAAVELMKQSPAQGPGVIMLGNGRLVAYTSLVNADSVTPARFFGLIRASHPEGDVMGYLPADKVEASIVMGFDCKVRPDYYELRSHAQDIRTAAERPLFELARPSYTSMPVFGRRPKV